ncbi:MAG: helix-turn-helix domain-containing protein [bacterium]
MTIFSRKPVLTIEPLGQKLRCAREQARCTLETLAAQTSIPAKYLAALETSRYDQLPSDVYVRNFLRLYCEAFHLSFERVWELYQQERHVTGTRRVPVPPVALPEPTVINIPRLLRKAGVLLGAAILLLYLGIKVQHVLRPPLLTILTPAEDQVTKESKVTVAGVTEPESTVQINGQSVFLGTDGHFSEIVDLQPGLNVIKISATKERSREQVVYRQVMFKEVILQNQPIISSTTALHP